MGLVEAARVRAILDRMAREKEIAFGFYTRVADRLEDVDQRRWFRRMGQDEKDQRKILIKHRKELCPTPIGGAIEIDISPMHAALAEMSRDVDLDYVTVLRMAVRTAEEARAFCDRASDMVPDRSCRIFLKILVEESRAHRDELLTALRKVEAEATAAEAEAA